MMFKKSLLIAALIIVLALLYRAGILPLPQSSSRVGSSTSYTGGDIAEKTAQFLDTTVKDDGSFELFYYCRKEIATGCAVQQTDEPPHSGQVVLAYFELYKKTQNQAYKEKADKAMELFLAKCKNDGNYCEWNYFPLYSYYKNTNDKKYKDAMLSISGRFLSDRPLISYVKTNIGPKLAILYEITGEAKYVDLLEAIAKRALAGELDNDPENPILYKEGEYIVREQSFYVIWSTYLPAYRATNDPIYLNAAKDIFAKANVVKHTDDFKEKDKMSDMIITIEVLLDLAALDKAAADTYRNQAKLLAQAIVADLWDTPENKRYTGDYGFVRSFNESVANKKQTLLNGWLVRLFLRMDEESFTL